MTKAYQKLYSVKAMKGSRWSVGSKFNLVKSLFDCKVFFFPKYIFCREPLTGLQGKIVDTTHSYYSTTVLICQYTISLIDCCLVSSRGNLMYSEVRTFRQKQNAVTSVYKSITTAENNTISLSGNHLIYARKSCNGKFNPM